VGACYDDSIRPANAVKRFSESAERGHLKASERIGRIQGQQVQVTRKLQVLVSVVQHNHLSPEFLFGEPAAFKPVFIYDDGYIRKRAREHDGFVAEFAGVPSSEFRLEFSSEFRLEFGSEFGSEFTL
jgi:hypothetical protein